MKKILTSGLLGGVLMLTIGMTVGQLFQALVDPLMLLFFLQPFLLALGLAWVWDKVRFLLKAESDFKKGLTFSLLFWGIATLPGMLISYASFPLSALMIVSWTTGALIQLLSLGFLFSKTLK